MTDWRVAVFGALLGAITVFLWVIIGKLDRIIKYLRNISFQTRERGDHWSDPGA